jgi:hypothetical protein
MRALNLRLCSLHRTAARRVPIGRSRRSLESPRRHANTAQALGAGCRKTFDVAASPDLPDIEALLLELVQLEQRERELSGLRGKLHVRLNGFPNDVTARQEQQLSAERRKVHRRIDELRAKLKPVQLRLEKDA